MSRTPAQLLVRPLIDGLPGHSRCAKLVGNREEALPPRIMVLQLVEADFRSSRGSMVRELTTARPIAEQWMKGEVPCH